MAETPDRFDFILKKVADGDVPCASYKFRPGVSGVDWNCCEDCGQASEDHDLWKAAVAVIRAQLLAAPPQTAEPPATALLMTEIDEWLSVIVTTREGIAVVEATGLLKRAYHALRSASPPAPAWQPIASAPKDGRVLLSYWQDTPQFIGWIEGAGWRVLMPPARGNGFGVHGNFAPFQPTHWMPLPEPPVRG